MNDSPRLVSFCRRAVIDNCSLLLCLGQTHARLMNKLTGKPCRAIDNGLSPSIPYRPKEPPESCARAELLFLSNLIRAKGLWIAAEATRELSSRGRSVRLTCAGSWARESDKAAFMADFGPEIARGILTVRGFADEMTKRELLSNAHFLMLPTINPWEGQPLVLIEAMAAGVVPLTTTHGGIPDLIRFPKSDLLAASEHSDPSGLCDKVLSILNTPSLYETLSARSRARFLAHLTFSRCSHEIAEALCP